MNFVVETIASGYREIHRQLRDQVSLADPAALPWVPASGTNPVSVLVIHTLGSEGEIWRLVAGVPSSRDRDAEFIPHDVSRQELLDRLAVADRLLDDLAPRVQPAALERLLERPNRSPQTGLHWLVTNYGHAREHLAHIELTLQLYGSR